MPRTPHLRAEVLEDRTAPAFLRLVQDPGGLTSYGTAGNDPSNPTQTSSEFVTTAELTVPFNPRTFGAVTTPVSASSQVNAYDRVAPGGVFSTALTGTGKGYYISIGTTLDKPAGLNGGSSTVYTYGLDPNVILAPLVYEVVAEAGEQVGQPVSLDFRVSASGNVTATQSGGLRQDVGFTIAGTRTSLLSRTVATGVPDGVVSNSLRPSVNIGDRFGLDFTQSVSAAGVNAATGVGSLQLLVDVLGPTQGAGTAGAGAGAAVKVFNDDGSQARSLFAFEPSFTGGVRVASADVNNDGTPDVIAGSGPGRPNAVVVLDGKTGAEITTIFPFESAFTGGVYVAASDLNGDGFVELAASADEGGGARVRVWVLGPAGPTPIVNFFGIEDQNFRGGARVAFGDITGDGYGDLIVAAGFGGGPRVAVFDGQSVSGGAPARAFNDFFVFEQSLRNGVFVTAGDIDGSGAAELIVGGGPGGGPRVLALSGPELATGQQVVRANYFAGDVNSRTGVRVGVTDLDGDTRADLLTGSGTTTRVTAYLGKNIGADGVPTAVFRDFEAFTGTGGVFVG